MHDVVALLRWLTGKDLTVSRNPGRASYIEAGAGMFALVALSFWVFETYG